MSAQERAAGTTRMRFGEGKISGAFAIFFGSLSLGGVLCFRYPDLLTTPEFRAEYDVAFLRKVLAGCMFVAFGCALRSMIANSRMRAGLLGAGLTGLALLLGGPGVEAGEVQGSEVYVSFDYLLLSLIAMALLFVPLELFLPERREQTKFHPEWKTDLAYFIFSHLFVQVLVVMSQQPVRSFFAGFYFLFGYHLLGLQAAIEIMPYLVQVFLAVLVADLFQYTVHRAFHSIGYLWRFHAVHHSTRVMDWLAGSRLHLVDVLITRMAVFLPLFVLGFSMEVLYAYVSIVATHAVLNHTNTRLPFGPLEYLVVTPRIHHWHHSTDPAAHNKNYAVHFPWIDRLLGTYHAPAGRWPEAVGLHDARFPLGFLRQLTYPFRHDPLSDRPRGKTSSR